MAEAIIYPCGDEGGVIVPPQSIFEITENGLYNIEHFRFVNVDVDCGGCSRVDTPYNGGTMVTIG